MYSADENSSSDDSKPRDSKDSEGEKDLEDIFGTFI